LELCVGLAPTFLGYKTSASLSMLTKQITFYLFHPMLIDFYLIR
jgi:hypothetical protein